MLNARQVLPDSEAPKPKKDPPKAMPEKRYKWWLCTWNNPPEDWRGALDSFKADFAIGQLEKGANGTIHIQFTLYFRHSITGARFSGMPFWHAGKPAAAGADISSYTSKSDTRIDGPYQVGTKPSTPGSANEELCAAFELAKEGRIEEIEGHIKLRYWSTLQKIESHYMEAPFRPACKGYWYFGPSNHGKTRYVEDHPNFKGAYPKNTDSYWDGYRDQKIVVFNDVHPTDRYFRSNVKSIVDHGRIIIPIKGASRALKATTFVVTSNYSLEEFAKRAGMVSDLPALEKRFLEIYKLHWAYPRTGIPILDAPPPQDSRHSGSNNDLKPSDQYLFDLDYFLSRKD